MGFRLPSGRQISTPNQPFLRYIHSMKVPPIVLSIAGFDPSSGAGITADVKTAAAHGCYAVTCLTALTVQSSQGVFDVRPVDPGLVANTLSVLAEDLEIAAVRVGMLGTASVAEAVGSTLKKLGLRNIVVDPVLRSSSGAVLLDEPGVQVLKKESLAARRRPHSQPGRGSRAGRNRGGTSPRYLGGSSALAPTGCCQAPQFGQPIHPYYRRTFTGRQRLSKLRRPRRCVARGDSSRHSY